METSGYRRDDRYTISLSFFYTDVCLLISNQNSSEKDGGLVVDLATGDYNDIVRMLLEVP